MKIAEIRNQFQSLLDPRFEVVDFALRKANFEYVRRRGDIRAIFRIEIHTKTDWFLVTPAAFVGSSTINKRFNSILNRNIQSTGSTCGFGVRNETDQVQGHYQLDSLADLPVAAEAIWSDFTEIASPFFERVDSIEGIEQYINQSQEGRCTAGSVSNACKGLIAASLSGKRNLNSLADTFYQFWSDAQSPDLARDILMVRDALIGSTSIAKT